MTLGPLIAALSIALAASAAGAASLTDDRWPTPAPGESSGIEITFPSHTPVVLEDVGGGAKLDPPRAVQARLFLPNAV